MKGYSKYHETGLRTSNTYELPIQYHYLPIVVVVIFISTCIVTFSLYLYQGRWVNYLPTISETGTMYLSRTFFAISFSIDAVLLMIVFILETSKIEAMMNLSKLSMLPLRILSVLCPFFLIWLSVCNLGESNILHSVGALLFFILCFVYLGFAYAYTYRDTPKRLLVIRTALLSTGFLLFIVMNISQNIHTIACTTINAICEISFLCLVSGYVLTFIPDLRQSKIEINVVIEQPDNN